MPDLFKLLLATLTVDATLQTELF